jgi:arylsulfatase A-like enzyme
VSAATLGCERPTPPSALRARLAELDRPNLVLIVVDMLRADRTAPYGHSREVSPELGRWAERGVVFERALAQSSWTKISMASLLTSLWPRSHGIRKSDDGLAEGARTVAELLREAGYRTYGVQTNGWLHQSFGFHQGFDRYAFPIGRGGQLPHSNIWPHVDRVYEEAVRLLDAHEERDPFFLYLHFMDVHEYAAPPEFKRFGSGAEGAYLAAIRWVDSGLLRVRELLARAGVLDRTVVVFASDHGEAFGENGKTGHARNVLSAVLWVPLVIRFPFPLEPVRVASQVRNVDIAPTLLELAGLPVPERFEGRSLLPLVTGEERGGDRPTYAALGEPLYLDASVQVSVNDGAWTYARNVEPDPNRDEFLFDRGVDPGENVNLIPREAEAADRMRALLERHLAQQPDQEVLETGVRIDPAIEQRLRAMGYLQ